MSSKALEKKNQTSQEGNPWSNLLPVTSFDRGTNLCSTRCIGERGKSKRNSKIVKKVSSSSILIGSLINQLCTVIEKDPLQRKRLYLSLCDTMHKLKFIDSSYNLGSFKLVERRYSDALYHLINIARSTIGSGNSIPIARPLISYTSPYLDQFRETGFIAGGGFGYVYKAVHKLDEVEYAIKKIVVRSGRVQTIMNHLEEVKTLAKLNHTNIVSYKQAWIEPVSTSCMPQLPFISKFKRTNSKNTFESQVSSNKKKSTSEQNVHRNISYKSKKSHRFLSERQTINYSNKIKNNTFTTNNSNSDIVSFRDDNEVCDISIDSETSNTVEINSVIGTDENISSDESLENHKICQYSAETNKFSILYIQMALCEKTLRQWLDERTESTPISLVAAITAQILCGLSYIHSLSIVHHDIKPSNIFISTSGKLHVQVGDFGLACPLQKENHEVIIGTCMYAAPEQLKGECNPKSDIYSLGIVLLELIIPMRTAMECIKIVENLKVGKIPTILASSHPKWANTISQLVQQDPMQRPSAKELLKDLKINEDLTITELQDENSRLQKENDTLLDENKKKDQIINDQKIMIEELKAKLTKLENENSNNFTYFS